MTERLSEKAAAAIYRQIMEFDSVLSRQSAIIEDANARIASAYQKIEMVEAERNELSAQLDRLAPDGFMEPEEEYKGPPPPIDPGFLQPSAQHPAAYRDPRPWHKPSVLPRTMPPGVPQPGNMPGDY
jgi:hypothetical protein